MQFLHVIKLLVQVAFRGTCQLACQGPHPQMLQKVFLAARVSLSDYQLAYVCVLCCSV